MVMGVLPVPPACMPPILMVVFLGFADKKGTTLYAALRRAITAP
jgi:hypothetical protein